MSNVSPGHLQLLDTLKWRLSMKGVDKISVLWYSRSMQASLRLNDILRVLVVVSSMAVAIIFPSHLKVILGAFRSGSREYPFTFGYPSIKG